MSTGINRKKWIVWIVLVCVALGTIYYFKRDKQPEVTYAEVPVTRKDIRQTILATGNVEPRNRLDIKAPIPGRIDEILVQEGQDLKRGQIIAWMSSSERAAMLDAARAKGVEEYKKWSELFLATPIIAPISGKLIKKNVEPGQSFTTADAIFVMSDRLTIKAQVDETDIAKIKIKGEANVQLDAYPDNILESEVEKIAFDSESVNNVTVYYVDVVPREIPEFMRSGMTANVTFVIENRRDVLAVPADAITKGNNKDSVRVKSPGKDTQEMRPVVLGLSDGKYTEVLEGLSDKDVLLLPEFKISEPQETKGVNLFGPPSRPRGSGGGTRSGGSR